MTDLVIIGTVALDNVETPFGKVENALGGSATFASYAASFFHPSGIVSVIGKDFPSEHKSTLEKKNISLLGVSVEEKTFKWEGFYEYDMNEAKTLKTELNALETFKPKIPEEYQNAKYIFLANIDPDVQLTLLQYAKDPTLVMMDTMNFWIEHKKESVMEVIKKTDVILLNDGEARLMFNTPNLVKAAKELLNMGPKAVIIKKGEHGALLFTNDHHFNAPGYPLEQVKDPTGCGDSFGGALIGYLAKTKNHDQKNLRKAMVYASTIASFNAEDFSLERMKKLSMEEIEKRYQEFVELRNF